MSDKNEIILESPPSQPGDDFWLEQGQKMVEKSPENVKEAAKAIIQGLGLLQSIYLAILGFSGFMPPGEPFYIKAVFLLPLVLWLFALYLSLGVLLTEATKINLFSPEEIREDFNKTLLAKQKELMNSYWALSAGLFVVILLIIFRIS
ncbi:hypothetical protein JXJ21_08225 [candidate division KSB1 bacterium]|nr:hypothetical protein [candidate division KSB1 bacterium]